MHRKVIPAAAASQVGFGHAGKTVTVAVDDPATPILDTGIAIAGGCLRTIVGP